VQNIVVKPATALLPPKPLFLSLNMMGVEALFPGFQGETFSVVYGTPASSVASLLCIRSQLPPQLGGLGSNVVFIDGSISFRLYNIARLAQLHQLNPEKVLSRIFISRAFTAYQLTELVMGQLEHTVAAYNAKVVIISDLAAFFLDSNIQAEEAQRLYSQVTAYLRDFAKESQVTLVATYLHHENTKRNAALQEITNYQADTVLRLTKTPFTREVALEKHPCRRLGKVELPTENRTLNSYLGGSAG
jgi:hypothetical protein